MYEFIDTNEVFGGVVLPAEALQINGEYIENLIDGYRTLSVSGREALGAELDTFETGVRDGARLKSRKYPPRTITVKYALNTRSSEEFRDAYNKLGGILNVKDAELVFNDESDKFFIGTPAEIGEVEAGTNHVIGEFQILCVNPFKYSLVEYEAESFLGDKSILIDYGGTHKSFPRLVAEFYKETEVGDDGVTAGTLTGSGDCGYVAFFDENKNIIQLGDPDEKDTETVEIPAKTLLNQTFNTPEAWGATAKGLWALNTGTVLPSGVQKVGTLGMGVSSYEKPKAPADTSGSLINVWSDGGEPRFYFKVTAKATGRTANTVKLTVSITASLKYTTSYFGRGYGLTAAIYAGGSWHTVKLKGTTEYWRGQTGHTVNLSFTVSGLSESQTSISGMKFRVSRSDSLGGASGNLAEKSTSALKISPYESVKPDTYYLTATNYGQAKGNWHGASMMRALTEESQNFTLSYAQKIACDNVGQLGGFQCHIENAYGAHICGVIILKNASGTKGKLRLYVGGSGVYNCDIDLTDKKLETSGTTTITKSGNRIDFNVLGIKKTITNDTVKDYKANRVTFFIGQYDERSPLKYNGLNWVKFVKSNSTATKNIPNKFSANDVVEADCNTGKVYLNGVETPQLGALGNDWEKLFLVSGINQIGVSWSDFVDDAHAPTFKVKYREVYL